MVRIDHRPDGDEAVFKALADAGRRTLLDALFRADGQPLGRLCAALPAMTRFGVMKHLAVLEQAGLVVTHRAGSAAQSRPSGWPSARNKASSSVRRPASARALKTTSSPSGR